MGEVWRAHMIHILNSELAIEVLPATFAQDTGWTASLRAGGKTDISIEPSQHHHDLRDTGEVNEVHYIATELNLMRETIRRKMRTSQLFSLRGD